MHCIMVNAILHFILCVNPTHVVSSMGLNLDMSRHALTKHDGYGNFHFILLVGGTYFASIIGQKLDGLQCCNNHFVLRVDVPLLASQRLLTCVQQISDFSSCIRFMLYAEERHMLPLVVHDRVCV